MIQFNQETCSDLDAALRREWLETNGLGGFASSTIIGLNTRRYHGLLVAATKPPVGRFVLLSKLEEDLIIDGQMFHLSANRYPHTVYPQGFQYLKEFRLDPFPVFTYDVERIEIEKTVFMVQGRGCRSVHRRSWRSEDRDCRLSLVRRLGPRHHDRAARPDVADEKIRYRAKYPADVCQVCGPGNAAQSIS